MARGRPSKKDLILETAQQLFAHNGYQGTSIDLVVREAGVSKPTVYNNFPSKQSLFQALVKLNLQQFSEQNSLLVETDLAYTDKLAAVLLHVCDNPFALSIFRVFYGEAHKLDNDSQLLCAQFELQLSTSFQKILAPLLLSKAQHCVILAIYKNTLLIEHLSGVSIEEATASLLSIKAQIALLKIDRLT